jgi:hypothetical protein
VARRHGLNPQQLFGWRARLRNAVKGPTPSSDATPAFVPAIVEDEPPTPAAQALPAVVTMGAAGVAPAPIEIALGGIIVRVRGEAVCFDDSAEGAAGTRMIGPAISASRTTQILVATKPVDFRKPNRQPRRAGAGGARRRPILWRRLRVPCQAHRPGGSSCGGTAAVSAFCRSAWKTAIFAGRASGMA